MCHAPADLAVELCSDCRAELPRQRHACRACALTLPANNDTLLCPTCLHQPRFDSAIAAFEYAPPVDWLITRLKFHHCLSHARLLGALLAERIAASPMELPDCIVPAPLHPRRYRKRGYNQSGLIAHQVARALHRPVATNLASRDRDTVPQRSLPANRREQNMRQAFTASSECSGRHIAILDDVVTTSHTACALATAINRSGAASVQLWCIARA